jgi:hypothetical protein
MISRGVEDCLLHVIPQGDWREHEPRLDCWCRPAVEDGVAVHNSLDGRELFERGERSAS